IEKSEYLSHLLSKPVEMTRYLREQAQRLTARLQEANETELLGKLAPYLKSPEAQKPEDFDKLIEETPETVKPYLEGIQRTLRTVKAIQKGLPHQVLNAKHHEKEALIVAQAGRKGAITIATNMAGRGTDILLGGNPEFLAKADYLGKGQDWRAVPAE